MRTSLLRDQPNKKLTCPGSCKAYCPPELLCRRGSGTAPGSASDALPVGLTSRTTTRSKSLPEWYTHRPHRSGPCSVEITRLDGVSVGGRFDESPEIPGPSTGWFQQSIIHYSMSKSNGLLAPG